MPSTIQEIKPYLAESDTGDSDGYAHYARSEQITEAAIYGGKITALCGYKFEPIRDPQKYPVCPKCKELVALAESLG